jgi:chorismate dehydratase
MNLTVGYIPYLNMVPFHQGFGPEPLRAGDLEITFKSLNPHALGIEAETGKIDAGAMSLVDSFRLEDQFEQLGSFGIGVKRAAGSVLLFSKVPMADLSGVCAVTDETSTSVRLLQVLLEKRYNRTGLQFGRIPGDMYDGSADALLLIGDEALLARQNGIKGLPVVTDLATEWYAWQGTPFVFARWVVRKELPNEAKKTLQGLLENSLATTFSNPAELLNKEAKRGLKPTEIEAYWQGFLYELTAQHDRAIEQFKRLNEALCLSG